MATKPNQNGKENTEKRKFGRTKRKRKRNKNNLGEQTRCRKQLQITTKKE